MDLSLTDDQQAFRDTARGWVEKTVVPNAAEWDRTEVMDRDIVRQLGEMGFLGATLPEELGGTPCDYISYVLLMEELGRGDNSVRGIVSVSLGLVTKSIVSHGTDEQKQQWVPRLASGEILGCFGLTEPGNGSDPGGLTTKAVRDGDDWLLSGQKLFITNGNWAGLALIFARTGGPGPRGITAFLVDPSTPGFSARPVHGKLGLRAQDTAELFLDDVRVPDRQRLGDEGKGFGIAMAALAKGRMSVAASAVGTAQAALDASLRFALERNQFGKPIASYQLVQEMLSDMSVDTDAARLMVWRAADLCERGEPFEIAASKAKYYASEVAVRVANNAIQVHGGYGFIDEYPVGKYLRDARVLTLYEGTSQIQKLIIGRDLTGINAFN
ncbi:MAG: acyl-CoA dehydrogenase family protein [Acidobacteria bacterium]|nr:acyl-CoA dehydrogenase family protein [Acidobacteriota bacterium]